MNRYRILPACAPGLLALILLFAPQASLAAVEAPWNLPALSAKPEDILRAAAASPAPKDGDVEMLFEEHVYKLDEQGRQHRTSRRVYRYLTDKGVDDWSCTEADWSPWCEEKPIFRVRVITPDGQTHALDQESIGEAPAEQETPNLFSDEKLLRGPLPAIVVGAVVEEEIETREIRPLFDHGIVERFLLAQQYAVRKLRLVIDAPSALPLKYEVLDSDASPTRTEDKGAPRSSSNSARCRPRTRPRTTCRPRTRSCRRSSFPPASRGPTWPRHTPPWSSRTWISRWSAPWFKRRSARKPIAARSSSGCWPRCAARFAIRAWNSARARSCRGLRARRWPGATAIARTRPRSWWRCSAWPAFPPRWPCCGPGATATWRRRCPGWATSTMPSSTSPATRGTGCPGRCGSTLRRAAPRPDICPCWTRTAWPCSPAPKPAR